MSARELQLEVQIMKEGDMFIAYSSALDLSTCGETFDEARLNFKEAARIFLEECSKDGTLEDILESLGWQKVESPSPQWMPPPIVGRVEIPILVPA